MTSVRSDSDDRQSESADSPKTIEEYAAEVSALRARVAALEVRLDAEEREFDLAEKESTPLGPDEPGHVGEPPRLAVRDDGRLLLVLADTESRDLSKREVVTCVVLTSEEETEARAAWSEGAHNAATFLLGSLPWARPPKTHRG